MSSATGRSTTPPRSAFASSLPPDQTNGGADPLKDSAERTQAIAKYSLGVVYYGKKDYDQAFPLFSEAATQGVEEAIYNVGICYEYGYGVEKDLKKAFEHYKQAADLGHIRAMCNLALCYREGNGVDKNLEEAFKWFGKAAEKGHLRSTYSLGVCYQLGEGVPQNYEKALEWYKKASDKGDARANERARLLTAIIQQRQTYIK